MFLFFNFPLPMVFLYTLTRMCNFRGYRINTVNTSVLHTEYIGSSPINSKKNKRYSLEVK